MGRVFYYQRLEKGKSYPLHCRKKGSLQAPEEIYFDENLYAKGTFFTLENLVFSPDQNLVAYAIDQKGDELFTLKIKDLKSGTTFPESIFPMSGEAVFAADNTTLFYLVADEAQRRNRLYRH